MSNQTTQAQRILAYLKRGKKLTAIEAYDKFQCFRLASRINQLKNEGHTIDSKIIKLPNGKHVAQYKLIKAAA